MTITAKVEYPINTMVMPKTKALLAHQPFFCVHQIAAVSVVMRNTAYTITPLLKAKPRSFTKNNSNLPAKCTAPLMMPS